jgi:hypothetical protein
LAIEFGSITQPLCSILFPELHRYYGLFRPSNVSDHLKT